MEVMTELLLDDTTEEEESLESELDDATEEDVVLESELEERLDEETLDDTDEATAPSPGELSEPPHPTNPTISKVQTP